MYSREEGWSHPAVRAVMHLLEVRPPLEGRTHVKVPFFGE